VIPFCALLVGVTFLVRMWDFDEPWHLATGRWVLEHGSIPHEDPFSFTAKGLPWHGVSWLSDTLYALAFRAGGMAGVVVLKALVASLAIGLLGHGALALGAELPGAVAAMLAFGVVHQGRGTTARPETWAAALLALTVLLVARELRGRTRGALYLPLVAFVWTQVHTSAVLAPLVVAAGVLAMLVGGDARWRRLGLVAVAASAVLLLPAGRDALHTISLHRPSVSPLAMRITDEWQRPQLGTSDAVVPFLLTGLGALGAARRFLRTRAPAAAFGLVLVIAGLALWLVGARNRGLLALLAAPAFAIALESIAARFERGGAAMLHRALPWMGALFVVVAEPALGPPVRNRLAFGFGVEDRFPTDTVSVLEALPPARVLSDYHYGGYLIWRGFPAFWDGRNVALYPNDMLRDVFIPAASSVGGLAHAQKQWELRYALADQDGMFVDTLMASFDWAVLSVGRKSVLMVHVDQGPALRTAGREPYRLLRYVADPQWLAGYYGAMLRDPARRAALHDEMLRSARADGTSWLLARIVDFVRAVDPQFVEGELAGALGSH
jgi:hypothetical protein